MRQRSLVVPAACSRVAALLVATLAFAPPVAAQNAQATASLPPMVVHPEGQKVKISGIIVDRNGDQMRVREGETATHTVMLTDDTRIGTPSGLFKMDRKRRDESNLLPGLMLQIKGHGSADGSIVADEITFSNRSANVAKQISVGGEVVRNQVGANTDSIETIKRRLTDSLSHVNARVTNLDTYDEKYSTVVNFPTNSAVLSDGAKGILNDMVNRVAGYKGYYIEVRGFADTTGATGHNLELSERRAEAVVRYLTEKDVPLRRILNPTGFGESSTLDHPSDQLGHALNRRATVRVLVSRGLNK